MISALFPGFLAAGAILAIAPIILHMLARRPPDREPLPTARFLREDARTQLRLQRRPTDLTLLGLRVLLALCLGAAFAGLTWTPGRSGTGRIILFDAGADPGVEWDAARATVQQLASSATDTPNTGSAPSTEAVIVAYGLDGGPRTITQEDLASLVRGSHPATAEDGLRALRESAISETFYEQAAVAWVMRPSWRAWTSGIGLLRPELWPGRIELHSAPGPESASETAQTGTLTARVAERYADGPLVRAVNALGIGAAEQSSTEEGASAADWVFASESTVREFSRLTTDSPMTIVFSGRMETPVPGIPWTPAAPPRNPRGGIVLQLGVTLATGITPGQPVSHGGTPTSGARTVAVFEDATPAAAAVQSGSTCIVYLATEIDDPALASSPEYPTLIDALGRACSRADRAQGPLDLGAIYALERPDLPLQADMVALGASKGTPLGRWMALFAALLLVSELWLTRSRPS